MRIFHSLQRRIVIVFVGLLTLVMLLILALVTHNNDRIVQAEMARELSAGTHVFNLLIEQNRRQLEIAATVLAADFAFREAIATQDRPTIQSVIRNHGLRIGAQVMLVISPDGQLVADTQHTAEKPRPFPFQSLLSVAESEGKSTGFRKMGDGKLYQLILVPVQAPKLIAWVAIGFLADDKWANGLFEMTGLAVSVVHRNGENLEVLASSLTGPKRIALPGALRQLSSNVPHSLNIANEPYQSFLMPLDQDTSVVLQRSIELAEAPYRSLQKILLSIVMAGIVIFAIGSVMLARRIVKPVNLLAAAARRIEAGNYQESVPILPPDEIGLLAASFDRMRERVASREQKILKLAYEDSLTGLANRTRLYEVFNHLPKDCQGAIAILNLDRFALINNALGHIVGDLLLSEIGLRFNQLFSSPDVVARLWGDEFAFLLVDKDRDTIARFAASILGILQEPVTLDGQRLDVAGCLGVAIFPEDGQDATTLIRRAEFTMYAAKRHHQNLVYAGDIGDAPQHEQLSLIGEMREAIANGEFRVYYQPKQSLASGKITGAEALIRWLHPKRGLLTPIHFIPFAEQTGFIREITPWILENVIAQTAQWQKEGLFIAPSINLSALDLLDSGLIEHIRQLIAKHALPAKYLCLEITESALMDDPELALTHLDELAALGLKLSIDDYGVGQASLAYLKTLPVHELKIDRIFITSVADSPKNAAIVQSTIALCHALNLTVVAEGIETADELDWLIRHECDIAQGYLIARPMPAEEIPGWIAAYSAPASASKWQD